MYYSTITQFSKMLQNFIKIFDKATKYAENKKFDPEVLLNTRLAPDQFNLIRQIQIMCDTAKLGAARLANSEAPSHADTEKTWPELKTRIESVVQYLGQFKESDFSNSSKQQITQARWEGKYLHGDDYATQHMIPNFYFHMTTAYSILRSNGVDVGKKDYLGELPFKK